MQRKCSVSLATLEKLILSLAKTQSVSRSVLNGTSLKTRELAGQIFEDESDLAIAVIDGVETHPHRKKYKTERIYKSVGFNPTFLVNFPSV